MDSNTTDLKNYITAAREQGKTDDDIYQSLVASGWSHEIITQAFSAEQPATENPTPVAPADSNPAQAAPADNTSYQAAAANTEPATSEPYQPPTTSTEPGSSEQPYQPVVDTSVAADKNVKKVKLIGKIMIGLGAVAVIGGVFPDINILVLASAAAQIAIGFGILAFNKIAYTLFNILAVLVIIAGLLMLPGVPFALFLMIANPSPVMILAILTGVVLSLAQLVFYVYGIVVFHKKDVRALFFTA